MSNWLPSASEDWLEPIYDALHAQLCRQNVLHADETTLKEHPRLSSRFAETIDVAYELGERKSDEDLRDAVDEALDDFFGNRQDCDIF